MPLFDQKKLADALSSGANTANSSDYNYAWQYNNDAPFFAVTDKNGETFNYVPKDVIEKGWKEGNTGVYNSYLSQVDTSQFKKVDLSDLAKSTGNSLQSGKTFAETWKDKGVNDLSGYLLPSSISENLFYSNTYDPKQKVTLDKLGDFELGSISGRKLVDANDPSKGYTYNIAGSGGTYGTLNKEGGFELKKDTVTTTRRGGGLLGSKLFDDLLGIDSNNSGIGGALGNVSNVIHNVGEQTGIGDVIDTVAPIAARVAGSYFGGPIGAGLVGTVISLDKGEDLQTALQKGAIAGATSYAGGELMPTGVKEATEYSDSELEQLINTQLEKYPDLADQLKNTIPPDFDPNDLANGLKDIPPPTYNFGGSEGLEVPNLPIKDLPQELDPTGSLANNANNIIPKYTYGGPDGLEVDPSEVPVQDLPPELDPDAYKNLTPDFNFKDINNVRKAFILAKGLIPGNSNTNNFGQPAQPAQNMQLANALKLGLPTNLPTSISDIKQQSPFFNSQQPGSVYMQGFDPNQQKSSFDPTQLANLLRG